VVTAIVAVLQVQAVTGLALDSSAQLYVSDSLCNQILKFLPNSNSTTVGTVFASSLSSPQGISINPLTTDLYGAMDGDNTFLMFANGSSISVVVAGA